MSKSKAEKVLVVSIGSDTQVCLFKNENGNVLLESTNRAYLNIEDLCKGNFFDFKTLMTQFTAGGKYKNVPAIILLGSEICFNRFVKLPPIMDKTRERQIMEYEIRQNIPFPVEEALFDFCHVSTDKDGMEINMVMTMARKDYVVAICDILKEFGFDPKIARSVNIAMCKDLMKNNAMLAKDEYSMFVDFGETDTNVHMVSATGFFCRTIPVATYTLRQQVMKEFSISMEQASDLIERNFIVGDGTDMSQLDATGLSIAKIARNIMTRIHTELVRSINAYKTMQNQDAKKLKYLHVVHPSFAHNFQQFFDDKMGANAGTIQTGISSYFWGPFMQREAYNYLAYDEGVNRDMNLLTMLNKKPEFKMPPIIKNLRIMIAEGLYNIAKSIEPKRI